MTIEQVLQALSAVRDRHVAEVSKHDAAFGPYDRAVLECIAAVAGLVPVSFEAERVPRLPPPCGGMAQNCQWVVGESTYCTCMIDPTSKAAQNGSGVVTIKGRTYSIGSVAELGRLIRGCAAIEAITFRVSSDEGTRA